MENENKKENDEIYEGKSIGPINIALIKYWGKDDEKLITPLNNSISLTLDTKEFYTETSIKITKIKESKDQKEDIIELTINNEKSKITTRIKEIINQFKILKPELNKNPYSYIIKSKNTFPIKSGCASSASSMSSLVICINKALKLNLSKDKLSQISRIGSGSACRSIINGISEWVKEGKNNSHAIQLYNKDYWKLNVMLIIVNQNKKEISSSDGMKLSKETSDFFNYRIKFIVDKHINEIKDSLKNKNFEKFGKVIMKESNNFHAVCRDTFPTINYLNLESEFIIKCVDEINKKENKIICAYTFDAGANAFLIFEEENRDLINNYFEDILFLENDNDLSDFVKNVKSKKPVNGKFYKKVIFELGDGAY